MSLNEQIEYLETQVAGLHDKVSELIAKVEELEKKLNGNYWLLDKNSPNVVHYPEYDYCQWCGKNYRGTTMHICPNYPSHWVDPNKQITCLTFNNKPEVLK